MSDPEITFSERLSRPDRLRIGGILAAGLVILVSAAVTMGASPAPANGAGASAAPQASANPNGPGDQGQQRPLRGPSWLGGLFSGKGLPFGDGSIGAFPGRAGFGAVTVTGIDGSNVSLKTDDGWTRTIMVNDATTITKGGQPAKVSDLAVGDQIRFGQTRNTGGTWTVNRIDIVIPTMVGTVTAVGSDTITIKDRSGGSQTIKTTGSTTYRLGNAAASRADVKVGSAIVATGSESGGSFTASSIAIRQPRLLGTVTATTPNSITIKRLDGTTVTVHVDSSTGYDVRGVDKASLSDVKAGMTIVVEGTQNADGSIDANAVHAGTLGRGGAWGKGGTGPAAAPEGSSSQG